ncbi:39S ribosomal protein L27, mitochondrial [Notechis scutatus]|uniref:39S ribosomal protein L27, mitochondrial n=1 Tax=Notechis scutatus TaxID=8663 RepID=A0A6J1TX71_9SAUR|nr:39S ribosomal protein L27, mitochondrial [Notechis scutatus]
MAALLGGLVALGSAAGRQLLPVPTFSATVVRFASKKSGGSTRNRGGNRTGKRYGFKKFDGQFVHAGNILATQRVIRWHPGAHVRCSLCYFKYHLIKTSFHFYQSICFLVLL